MALIEARKEIISNEYVVETTSCDICGDIGNYFSKCSVCRADLCGYHSIHIQGGNNQGGNNQVHKRLPSWYYYCLPCLLEVISNLFPIEKELPPVAKESKVQKFLKIIAGSI